MEREIENSLKKIAVIGPESTGKSTLCEGLSEHFDIDFIKEYSREFLTKLEREYTELDLLTIAKEQSAQISYASGQDQQLMIADTELLTIKIWSDVKYGRCNEEIEKMMLKQDFDLYLLCDTDVPWQDDPLREVPDLDKREEIFELFKIELERLNWHYQIISGYQSERQSKAIEIIKSF